MTLFAGTQYEIKCRPTSWVLCNKFIRLEILLKIFCRPATPIHELNRASLNLITTTLTQSTSAQLSHAPAPPRRHQPGQFIYDLTLAPEVDQPNDSQTNIHSNRVSLDMTALPTTNTLNQCAITSSTPRPRMKSLCKQGTETILPIYNTIYIMDFFK